MYAQIDAEIKVCITDVYPFLASWNFMSINRSHIVIYFVKLSITKLALDFTFTPLSFPFRLNCQRPLALSLSLFLNFFSNFLQFFISSQIFLFLYLFLLVVAVAFLSLGSSNTFNFAIGVKMSSCRLDSEFFCSCWSLWGAPS
jgi:hypothetical protein